MRNLLSEAHVDALFSAEDASDGRMLVERVPVRVLSAENGQEYAAALVSVGALNVEVAMHETGDLALWCAHDEFRHCAHAAAAILALVERDEPFGVGGVGGTGRRRRAPQGDPWERALRGVLAPDPDPDRADPPGEIALLFSVLDARPGDPRGAGAAIRPATRASDGGWATAGISWDRVSGDAQADPRWRALAEVEALHAGRHNFAAASERIARGSRHRAVAQWRAPDWIRLDATPSPGLWPALLAAFDAGVEFVSQDGSSVDVSGLTVTAVIDLRMVGGRLWVEPTVLDRAGPSESGRLLPVGAPTTAFAHATPDGQLTRLLPLEVPTTAEFDDLHARGHLSIPATRIPDFSHDYLPRLREVATLTSSDASFTVPTPSPPQLILAIRHAEPVTRLYWEWEYPAGERRDRQAERALMRQVTQAAGRFAHLLGGARSDRVFPSRDLDRDETIEFLAHVLPALREVEQLRIEAHDEVPAYEFATEEPQITVGADPSGEDWFELNIVVTIQGEPVSSSELLTALSHGRTYFRLLSGTVFPLTDPRFARLRDVLAEAKTLRDQPPDHPALPRYQVDLWQELAEVGILDAQQSAWFDSMKALGDDGVERRDPPASFRAELRDYQRDGFSWLDFLRRNRLGGVLADDMGLGKTVQLLAAFDQARVDEPGARFLVVAPTSVVGHWVAEAERFAPELGAVALAETVGKRGSSVAAAIGEAPLVVTSYAILRRDAAEFHRVGFRVVALDEAQQVKNPSSNGYAAARAFGAPTTFVVTGTPLENNLMELFALATLAAPGLFGTRSHFREHFQRAIEKRGNSARLDQLRARVRPFLLRRTKEQVAPELPPKTEQVLEIELHSAHQRAYDRRFRREQQKLLGLLDDVSQNQIQILASLTRLRREALHPAFGDAEGGTSAKLDALGELLDEIVADGHRVLVFSQFTDFLGLAAAEADKRGVRYSWLSGSTSAVKRTRMVERFQSGQDPAFFISLKAGGTGLNLTAADYCILLDPWWNPAAEEQAIDRTHRIGQDKPVVVYRLIAAGTIEQKVRDLQAKKRRLFEDVLGGSAAPALTADDYRALLS